MRTESTRLGTGRFHQVRMYPMPGSSLIVELRLRYSQPVLRVTVVTSCVLSSVLSSRVWRSAGDHSQAVVRVVGGRRKRLLPAGAVRHGCHLPAGLVGCVGGCGYSQPVLRVMSSPPCGARGACWRIGLLPAGAARHGGHLPAGSRIRGVGLLPAGAAGHVVTSLPGRGWALAGRATPSRCCGSRWSPPCRVVGWVRATTPSRCCGSRGSPPRRCHGVLAIGGVPCSTMVKAVLLPGDAPPV
jgi:hypothetical protein